MHRGRSRRPHAARDVGAVAAGPGRPAGAGEGLAAGTGIDYDSESVVVLGREFTLDHIGAQIRSDGESSGVRVDIRH